MHLGGERGREVGGGKERLGSCLRVDISATPRTPGSEGGESRPLGAVQHQACEVWAADYDDCGPDERVVDGEVPGAVAAEGDAEGVVGCWDG